MATKRTNYCEECDKDFKSLVGLNGHNQWKHNKLNRPVVDSPTGRTVQMLEQLAIQQNQMQDRILGLQSEIQKLEISLQAQNNNQGNNRGSNTVSNEPIGIGVPSAKAKAEEEEEPDYVCNDCRGRIVYGQERCDNCRARLDWSGFRR